MPLGIAKRSVNTVKPPHVRKNRRCYTEGDGIGQRIELFAELAGGVGHSGDAAVEAIEENGKADGTGGEVKVPTLAVDHTRNGLRNRVISRSDVYRRKQRRQDEHALAHSLAAADVFNPAQWMTVHLAFPCGLRLLLELPAICPKLKIRQLLCRRV